MGDIPAPTQNPVQTNPVKPVVVVTAKMILDNILSKLPNFTARNDLELLLMILTTYIGTDSSPVTVQLGPAKAIKNLITFKKINSVDDIDTAHMNVYKSLSSSMERAYVEFEAETGKEFKRNDFSAFEKEYVRESAEQDGLRKSSENALNNVRKICGELGLANPDPALSPDQTEKPEKVNHVRNLARAIGEAFVSVKNDDVSDNQSKSISRPGWTTPPILDQEFYHIDDFVNTIIDYMKALEEQKKTDSKIDVAAGTLAFYAAQGYSREKIIEEFGKYCKYARDQIAQSEKIMADIFPEYNSIKDIVQTVSDTRAISDSVKEYCHSA